MNELRDFIITHPTDWPTRLTGAPYNLKYKIDGNLIIFSYSQIESDFSNPIVQEARGIILNMETWEVVCRPMSKFFNYGEANAAEIDWSTAVVREKVDGSLMKLWWNDEVHGWWISTNGTIDAAKAPMNSIHFEDFADMFDTAAYNSNLYPIPYELSHDYTYMFEMVSPENRIVVHYPDTELYYLGRRNKITGEEILSNYDDQLTHMKRPRVFSLSSLEDCIKAAEALPADNEGYVVNDQFMNRVKIKSPWYITAHYLRNNGIITSERILNIILTNEVEEVLVYAPELGKDIALMQNKMQRWYWVFRNAQEELYNSGMLGCTRKEIALYIVAHFNKQVQGYLFKWIDKGMTVEDYLGEFTAAKWDKLIGGKYD